MTCKGLCSGVSGPYGLIGNRDASLISDADRLSAESPYRRFYLHARTGVKQHVRHAGPLDSYSRTKVTFMMTWYPSNHRASIPDFLDSSWNVSGESFAASLHSEG